MLIKLKKEYIGKFGDVGDFAVVGASYDAIKSKELRIPDIKWTTFWIACLENKEEVHRWEGIKPRFKVITTVTSTKGIIEDFFRYTDPNPVSFENNAAISLDVANGIANGKKPTTVFTRPPIFDMRCFGFDKEGNTGFWTLRFPNISKIHLDRTYKDTISFDELQDMAAAARNCAEDKTEIQKDIEWITKLKKADPRGIAVDAITPSTTRGTQPTFMTPSPRRRSESTASPLAMRTGFVRDNTMELVRGATTTSANSSQDHGAWGNPSMTTTSSRVGTPVRGAMGPPDIPGSESQVVVKTSTLPATACITLPQTSLKRTLVDCAGTPLVKRRQIDSRSQPANDVCNRGHGTSNICRSNKPLENLTGTSQSIISQDNIISSASSEPLHVHKYFPSKGNSKVNFDIFCDEENEPFLEHQSTVMAKLEKLLPLQSAAQPESLYITPTSSASQNVDTPSSTLTRSKRGPRPCDLSKCQIFLSPA